MDESSRPVRPPTRKLAARSWDTHAHIFGPYERFPLAAERRYTPPLAPFENYLAMLDQVGFARGVLVHPGASGYDCSATLDALARAGGRLRGIVVPRPDIGVGELQAMHACGVRGIRFTQAVAPGEPKPGPGILDLQDLQHFAPRLRELGWHAQLLVRCGFLVEAAPELLGYGIPLVIDHMGYFEAARGVADRHFQALLRLLETGQVWLKLTAIRNSTQAPHYSDLRPFHETLLRTAPQRLLWGSDWPYIGMDKQPPDVGDLLDLFDAWTDDESLRKQILVTNPAALYDD